MRRFTEEHIKNLRLSHLGQKAWNKGLAKKKYCLECGNLVKHRSKSVVLCKVCSHKEERSANWKGGITPINKLIRHSFQYRQWRTTIFERDDFTCQICGQKGGQLEADHIKPFSLFPELIFNIDNGRTLCKECHKIVTKDFWRARKEEYASILLSA